MAALQIQRHQLPIKIFIFLLLLLREWIHFTQNDMHINKQICKEIQDSKVQRQGKRDKKKEIDTNKTRDKTSIWSVVIV